MSVARRIAALNLYDLSPDTEVIELPSRVPDGCRTVHDGERCGHSKADHRTRGFEGWKVRCVGCGCNTWRMPWAHVVLRSGEVALWVFAALLVLWMLWGVAA